MSDPTNYRQAHIAAIRAARGASHELGLDEVGWIDSFDAVVRAGAFLAFKPLRALFGVYLPGAETGGTPGVLINVRHPLNLQRYTAAHELGHLWMGHTTSIDTESEIFGALGRNGERQSPVEVAAEVFAAHLLMPLNRVLPRIRAMGLGPSDLERPEPVYALSLWFGVSYRAMVHQLVALRQLQQAEARHLLGTAPKAIKQNVLGGGSLDDWHSDVWSLTSKESGELLHVRVGDELAITLPSHASGGFSWDSSAVDDRAFEIIGIETVSSNASEPGNEVIGSAPMRRARIRVKETGRHDLSLSEVRPWQRAGRAASEFHLTVVGVSQPANGAAEQLRRRLIA